VGVVEIGPRIWKYPFRLEALEFAKVAPTADGAVYPTTIIHIASLTREQGKAVALGRVLVRTRPNLFY
jgi:hypothetical protein